MNIFYNPAGVGDTLLIAISETDRNKLDFERKADIVRLFNRETKETLGYNIFKISKKLSLDEKGLVKLTEQLIKEINGALEEAGFSEFLQVDLSPKFVVGLVTEKEKHPNADKLSVCQVDIGDEELQIVCGAANVVKDQRVVVAKVGAVMPSGLQIKDAELRGIPSSGMICSATELGQEEEMPSSGILVLDETYEIGQEYKI